MCVNQRYIKMRFITAQPFSAFSISSVEPFLRYQFPIYAPEPSHISINPAQYRFRSKRIFHSQGLESLWHHLNDPTFTTVIYAMDDQVPKDVICALSLELSGSYQKKVLFWPCPNRPVNSHSRTHQLYTNFFTLTHTHIHTHPHIFSIDPKTRSRVRNP